MEYSDKMINHLLKLLDGETLPIKMRCSDLAEDTLKMPSKITRCGQQKTASGKVN